MKKNNHNKTQTHGGARVGAGRKPKPDKEKKRWGHVQCVLRKETIEQLYAGAGSRIYGKYLQFVLDQRPLPTHDQYLRALELQKRNRALERKASRRPRLGKIDPAWKRKMDKAIDRHLRGVRSGKIKKRKSAHPFA